MPDDDPRVATVNEHMRLENVYDFPACIGKFGHAKYEVVADGELFDGPDRVHAFLSENRRAFPDFEFVPSRVSPTTDAVPTWAVGADCRLPGNGWISPCA